MGLKKGHCFTMAMPPEIKDFLRAYGDQHGLSMAAIILNLIRQLKAGKIRLVFGKEKND